jgi:ABC-2 type transport system ATP-binding protein
MIELNLVSKSYGSKSVLKSLNLNFPIGQIIGLVGENGAGKTTLFKCIVGLENYEGKINFDSGIDKNNIGYLPTNPYFLSKITGIEYLRLLANARKVNVKSFEEYNVFDLPLDKYADTFSTGMQKKLAITGLIIQKNNLFVLDEPFSGVDIHSNILLKSILIRLREAGKTVIISSHILAILTEICDELHHLKSGEIVSTLKKDEYENIENEMISGKSLDRVNSLKL